jgi:hypothetical protein
MTFTGRYEVTQRLQDEMTGQFFFGVMLRPRLPAIIACLAVLGGLVALPLPAHAWIAGFLSAVALLIVVTWTRTFFAARSLRTGCNG